MKQLLRKPLLLLSFLFLGGTLAASFIHSVFFDSHIPRTPFITDNTGTLQGPPFAPFDHSILGTDSSGNHLLFYMLQGAKYTMLGTLAITIVCMIIALGLGAWMGQLKRYRRVHKAIEQILMIFYFVPAALIIYQALFPLLWESPDGFATSLLYRLIVESIFISLVLVPAPAILIANEASVINQREFAVAARLMGASSWQVFWKHIFPSLRVSLFTLGFATAIQVILIMTHLGIFNLFYGGTEIEYGMGGGPPTPVVYDWGSLVGMYQYTLQLSSAYWLVLVPLIGMSLFVLSLSCIIKETKKIM